MSAPADVVAYARRLLLVPDLEVKLTPPPPGLTDVPSGDGAELPDRPARPPSLVPTAGRAKVPPLSGMADPAQRARLLHGWFNHELQAVELFAWGLLRFADAPSGFRRGLLELLVDEQRHARLYLDRLAVWGHGPGDFPVSAYLWEKRGSMHTPLRFVAAMCLVFEQANLDHTVDAAVAARDAGDEATAAVLDRVHHEERRHVAFGLRWLERLAPEGRDLVEVWQESLDWPLRPALARGPVAHREPRLALDMPPEWLALVESAPAMTRTLVANLAGEAAWAGETLPRAVRQRLAAAGSLLRCLAAPGDRLWLEAPLAPACMAREAGWPRPELVVGALTPGDVLAWMAAAPIHEAVARCGPGGWSLPEPASAQRYLSRRFGHELSEHLGVALPGAAGACDLADLDAAVARLPATGSWVLKPAFSAAGRGLVRGQGALEGASRTAARRLLDRDGWIEVQPWLARASDFGCTGFVDEQGRVGVNGAHGLETDERGGFRGIVVAPPGERPPGLSASHGSRLAAVCDQVGEALATAGHRGPFAVDACVDTSGRLHPLIEVNARMSFGWIARALVRQGGHGLRGAVRLRFGRGAVPAGDGEERVALLHPDPAHEGGGTSAWLEAVGAGSGCPARDSRSAGSP